MLSSEASEGGGFNSRIKTYISRPDPTQLPSPLKDFVALPGIEKIMKEMENSINDILSKETLKGLIDSHMHDIKDKETI